MSCDDPVSAYARKTLSYPPCVEAATTTAKLYQQSSEALVQQLAVPECRTNGTDPMKRVQMAMYSKKRAGGSFRGNTYFPHWKIRDLDPRLRAI